MSRKDVTRQGWRGLSRETKSKVMDTQHDWRLAKLHRQLATGRSVMIDGKSKQRIYINMDGT